ncbi:DUF4136 domain-containing protein [Filimonas effusa]|uniref:DUF4136 domain-containing protein n=1 Tax=Filimonas effusa TaxID=2508721 RepID=A0A4Q1D0M1_9BACT|nr:DUF4136 domain-containing protein [Filimonas effusa]RXK81212.1 DUF4136 domain-containing protein [Filimonas effusa]
MRRFIALLSVVTGLSAVATSCVKDPVDHLSPEESRIYITNFDSTANFSTFKTYSISDSVAVIADNGSAKSASETDKAYIAAVKKYMAERGYTLVTREAVPDLGVNVNRIYNTRTGVISYPDYWGYYGGYWDPYYWGYGGYNYYVPYSYATYQITEGALSVDILDLKNAASHNSINVIWTGLVRGSGIFNTSVADSQVKALFDQSSYLKAN